MSGIVCLFLSASGLLLQPATRANVRAIAAVGAHAGARTSQVCCAESDADRIARLQAELAQLQEEEKSLDDDVGGIDDILFELGDSDEDDSDGDAELSSLFVEAAPSATDTDTVQGPRPPPNDVPRGATVAVAGGTSAIGQQLMRALFASDNGWKLRALMAKSGEGVGNLAAFGVEAAPAGNAAALKSALEDVSALLIISSSAAGGKGGIENEQIKALVAAIPDTIRRVVFLSSHGVERTDQLPFSLQNAWGGPLDKLRAAEQEVVLRAMNRLPSYSVVRVGKLLDTDDDAKAARAELAPGDDLQGELSAAAASAFLVESLVRSESVNASFSLAPLGASKQVVVEPSAPEALHYDDQFVKLVGPEVYRRSLAGSFSTEELLEWLREFALRFVQPGSGLTTPIQLDELDGRGVVLRFVQKNPNAGYAKFGEEETDDQKWAKAKASAKQSKATPDGALHLIAEVAPFARIRVARAEMGPDIIVKAMSEQTILEALDKAVGMLEKVRGGR